MILNRRPRSFSYALSVGTGRDSRMGHPPSARRSLHALPPMAAVLTTDAGVEGCPCRIDFSRADALLMASSGSATSMSFLRDFAVAVTGPLSPVASFAHALFPVASAASSRLLFFVSCFEVRCLGDVGNVLDLLPQAILTFRELLIVSLPVAVNGWKRSATCLVAQGLGFDGSSYCDGIGPICLSHSL
jgi:hypothetical protein